MLTGASWVRNMVLPVMPPAAPTLIIAAATTPLFCTLAVWLFPYASVAGTLACEPKVARKTPGALLVHCFWLRSKFNERTKIADTWSLAIQNNEVSNQRNQRLRTQDWPAHLDLIGDPGHCKRSKYGEDVGRRGQELSFDIGEAHALTKNYGREIGERVDRRRCDEVLNAARQSQYLEKQCKDTDRPTIRQPSNPGAYEDSALKWATPSVCRPSPD